MYTYIPVESKTRTHHVRAGSGEDAPEGFQTGGLNQTRNPQVSNGSV